MPRYLPNMLFSDCWSSFGQVTFYHRDGECYWRKKSNPQFPGTPLQLETLAVHSRALQAWKELDSGVQHMWNFYARDVQSSRPPFTKDHHISGHNLFVSAYHGFARLGNEHVPLPQPYEKFPVFSCEYDSVVVSPDGIMNLRFRVFLKECDNPERYRLAVRLQMTKVGAGKRPGYMRGFIAGTNLLSSNDLAEISIPNYREFACLDSEDYQIHMRYFLLDTRTGYRNLYKSSSFIVVL